MCDAPFFVTLPGFFVFGAPLFVTLFHLPRPCLMLGEPPVMTGDGLRLRDQPLFVVHDHAGVAVLDRGGDSVGLLELFDDPLVIH